MSVFAAPALTLGIFSMPLPRRSVTELFRILVTRPSGRAIRSGV